MLSFLKKKKPLSLSENHIILEPAFTAKADVLKLLADQAVSLGICRNALTIFQAFKDREDQSSTGVGYGFAIPHARHQEIQQAGILFYRSSTPITNWESMDDQPITCAIALLIPEVSASEHLKVLAKIATKLLDEEFTAALKQETDVKNITKLLEDATKEPQ